MGTQEMACEIASVTSTLLYSMCFMYRVAASTPTNSGPPSLTSSHLFFPKMGEQEIVSKGRERNTKNGFWAARFSERGGGGARKELKTPLPPPVF